MRGLIVGAALAVAVATAGCADEADPLSEADESSTTAEMAGECAPDDADAGELAALTVDVVPQGFVLQADDVGDTGPSDLAKAVRDDGEEDAEDVLTDLEFRRGYQWLWVDAADQEVASFVYEFCDAAGSGGYRDRGQDLLATYGLDVDVVDVPELDGEVAYAGEFNGWAQAVIDVVDGPYYVRIMAGAETGSVPLEELTARAAAVMAAQLQRL